MKRRARRAQIHRIERARLERMEQVPGDGPHAMVRLLARVFGDGIFAPTPGAFSQVLASGNRCTRVGGL
jgi:hypothetical protein